MGAWAAYGAEVALKSDFKPKLQIVNSMSLSVSSLLQSQPARAPELTLQRTDLEVGSPSSAHLTAVGGGDMDKGQRILQGPCGSTRAPGSAVTRNSEVYGWSDARRWHSHRGPCGEVEPGLLWVRGCSRTVQSGLSLSCA